MTDIRGAPGTITCDICGEKMTKKRALQCSECGKTLCRRCVRFYVDGNNISITKYSPPMCRPCYDVAHPGDQEVGPDFIGTMRHYFPENYAAIMEKK
jgi:hypothetical protein